MFRKLLFVLLCSIGLLILPGISLADEPMIGEIRMWSSTLYIPPGWVVADGTNMQTDLYPDLCYRLGTTYGSAPSGYCKLPDMRGRNAVGYYSSQTEFNLVGKTGGERTHTLTTSELPSHNHSMPIGAYGSAGYSAFKMQNSLEGSASTNSTGGDQPHNVLDPYLTVYYIIYVGGPDATTPTPTLIATLTPGPTATSTATPTGTMTPTITPTPGGTPCTSIFPDTTILDDFDRADGGLGSDWTALDGTLGISSNQAWSDGGTGLWNTEYGESSQVFATFPIRPNDGNMVTLFIRANASTSNGWIIEIHRDDTGGDDISFRDTDPVGSWPITWDDGDSFGIRAISNDTAEIWHKPVAGSWTLVDTAISDAVGLGGYIGFFLGDTTARLDDFGGGNYVPGTCSFLPLVGVVTGSLTITNQLPGYAYTTTLTTGNEAVFFRSASYGEIIAGAGSLILVFILIFWAVAQQTMRPG